MSLIAAILLLAPVQDPPVCLDERLELQLVAREPDLVTPTGMAVDAKGRVWVVESHTHFPPKDYKGRASDRILVFEDFAPDGRARKTTTFAEGFVHGMSLAFAKNGDLYFATRSEIYRFRGPDRATIARLVTKGNYPHNGLCGFAFDAAGDLYFGMGENLGMAWELIGSDGRKDEGGEGGNVYRCRPDGSGLEKIAVGAWNPFHMAFDARDRLFVVDNDADSRPPCRLLHIIPGGDYGFRFRNGRKGLHPFTSWNGELPGTLPMAAATGEAPSGLVAYEHDAFPAEYRGTLLATSWGDHLIQRFALVPRGASFTAVPETIVKGGEHFRPVALAMAPDGSLFMTDWVDKSYPLHGKGRLWRLRARSPGTAAVVSRCPPDPPALVRLREIQALSSKEALPALVPVLADPDPFLVSAAIGTLARAGGAPFLLDHAGHNDPKIRLGILLALRRTPDISAAGKFLADPDPAVRRAAVQWAGEAGLVALAPQVEAAASRPPVTRELFEAYLAAMDALSGQLQQSDAGGSESLLARVLDDADQPALFRAFALRMVRRDHPSVAIPRLAALAAAGDPELRLEAVRALAAWPDEAAQAVLRRSAGEPALRFEAVMGLAHSAESSAETRSILLAELDGPAGREALRSLSGALSHPGIAEAFEKKGGEEASLFLGRSEDRPAAAAEWMRLASEPGDRAAGERVFVHPRGPQCVRCHRVNGRGGIVGPDLSAIGNSLDRARLAESILDPSREVAPMFVNWRVVRRSGEVVDGRLLEEDPAGAIVLIDAHGRVTRIPLSEIEERRASQISVMPDKLTAGLSRREFRDLIEYLASLK